MFSITITNVLLLTLTVHLAYLAPSVQADYALHDCGVPLSKSVYFNDLEVYPTTPTPGDYALINVNTFLKSPLLSGTVGRMRIYFYDTLQADIQNIDVCNMRDSMACPIAAGNFEYTDLFDVVYLPDGNYTIQLDLSYGSTAIGCGRIFVSIKDTLTRTSNSCNFTSEAKITVAPIGSSLQFQRGNTVSTNVGDWVQVGSIGQAPSALTANYPFGRFSDISATEDLIGVPNTPSYDRLANPWATLANIESYLWGFNGTVQSIRTDISTNVRYETIQGNFFVGYNDTNLALDSWATSLAFGTLQLVRKTQNITGQYVWTEWTSGFVNVTPSGSLAPYWGSISAFGRLGLLQLSIDSQGNMLFSASEHVCGCGISSCGICGGNETYCQALLNSTNGLNATSTAGTTTSEEHIVTSSSGSSSSGLSLATKLIIVVAVIGGVFILGALAVIYLVLKNPSVLGGFESDDLLDPQKPDYGALAIADVLNDTEEVAPARRGGGGRRIDDSY